MHQNTMEKVWFFKNCAGDGGSQRALFRVLKYDQSICWLIFGHIASNSVYNFSVYQFKDKTGCEKNFNTSHNMILIQHGQSSAPSFNMEQRLNFIEKNKDMKKATDSKIDMWHKVLQRLGVPQNKFLGESPRTSCKLYTDRRIYYYTNAQNYQLLYNEPALRNFNCFVSFEFVCCNVM